MEFATIDLGRMTYERCVDYQRELLEKVASGEACSTLLFVEHDSVLTLGANFHEENLLKTREEYEATGVSVVRTDRGGDVTYHGPGQLVAYPIFDLSKIGKDLHAWLRDLEETMIRTVGSFGLVGRRFAPHTGAWVNDRKIAAIGIKVRRWVSMHGIALNCDNDLSPFEQIVPCGIRGYGVTSLSQELNRRVTVQECMPIVERAFQDIFSRTPVGANGSH